jgi:DNA-binding NtrC family response regulator
MNVHSETILIVADEQVVRRLLTSSLSGQGYKCLEACSAEEAQEVLKNHATDVALMDIKMPGKSGIELLTEMSIVYPDTAVIMISAESSSDTALGDCRCHNHNDVRVPRSYFGEKLNT